MDAGDMSCVLPGEREVAGPRAVTLAAGFRFAVACAFGGLGLGLAERVLFGFVFAVALLFDVAPAEVLLFGRALTELLLFGCTLAGLLLFGDALAAGFAFLGLPRFLGVGTLRAACGASARAVVAGFCVVLRALAVGARCTARSALAGAARWALAGVSCAPGVV